ncbi:MAG: lysylphosphatidylglycerol synthase domain-containing protein [Vicinamibacterales bacterium]
MRATRSLTLAGLLTAAAGIALFVWIVWNAGPQEIWEGIRQVGWGLLAVIVIAGLRFGARAVAWIRCLEPPHTLRLVDAFMAVVSGDALGNATPLGPLVGEPAKVAFVRRRVPLGVAFTALAIENLFYTLSVAAVIAAGTIALLLRGGLASDMRLAAEIAIALVLAAYVAVVLTLWRKPALLSNAITWLGRRWRSPRLHAQLDKVQRLEQDIYTFASRRRQAVVALVATELLFHALGVLEVHLTLWLTLGDPPPLVTSFILETANRLVVVLFKFVPMQQPGLNEVSTVVVAQLLGFSTQAGSTLAFVRRARMLFWQLAGTGLLVRHGVTARRILDDAELSASG